MISLECIGKIREVSNMIKRESLRYPDCIAVYLFGSFLQKEFPDDIDVLVVYDDSECDVNCQIEELSILLEDISNLPVDLIALSEEELKETAFLDKLNHKYIRLL